jgi:sugar phosphate isomerase/epimerase
MLSRSAWVALSVMLAVPLGIRIAYEGLSWGRTVNEYTTAWDVICRADAPNLGLGLDSYHAFATSTPLDGLDRLDPQKIFLVQLSDFMWQETRTVEERITTARTFRVFPGEGVHSAQVAELVTRLDAMGYRGDYSFEVFNDDYQQLPLPLVARRAHASARGLGEEVYLDVLTDSVARGEVQADRLLAQYHGPWGEHLHPIYEAVSY